MLIKQNINSDITKDSPIRASLFYVDWCEFCFFSGCHVFFKKFIVCSSPLCFNFCIVQLNLFVLNSIWPGEGGGEEMPALISTFKNFLAISAIATKLCYFY